MADLATNNNDSLAENQTAVPAPKIRVQDDGTAVAGKELTGLNGQYLVEKGHHTARVLFRFVEQAGRVSSARQLPQRA